MVGHVAKNNYLCSMKQEKKRTSIGLNKENKRKVYLKASDFMLDLAKLVFGGIILTGIMMLRWIKLSSFRWVVSLH